MDSVHNEVGLAAEWIGASPVHFFVGDEVSWVLSRLHCRGSIPLISVTLSVSVEQERALSGWLSLVRRLC